MKLTSNEFFFQPYFYLLKLIILKYFHVYQYFLDINEESFIKTVYLLNH